MFGILAHFGKDHPAARAFLAVCMREYDSRTRHIRKTEGALRRWAPDNRCARGDGDFRKALIIEETRIGFAFHIERGRGFQARTDHLVAAGHLQRARYDAAKRADTVPFFEQRLVRPLHRRLLEELEMDASLHAVTRRPGFFHGEAEKRREPGHDAGEKRIDHRARGAAAEALFRIAIEDIFADVEIERRQ